MAAVPGVPRLDAALERAGSQTAAAGPTNRELEPVTSASERLGALLYRISPVPLIGTPTPCAAAQGQADCEFYADKAVMMIIGAVLPGLVGLRLVAGHRLDGGLAGAARAWPEW